MATVEETREEDRQIMCEALDIQKDDVEDIKGLAEMPEELQELFRQYGKVFAHMLDREKKIDTIHLKAYPAGIS